MPEAVRIGQKVIRDEIMSLSLWSVMAKDVNPSLIKKTTTGVYYIHLDGRNQIKDFFSVEGSSISETFCDDGIMFSEFVGKVYLQDRIRNTKHTGYIEEVLDKYRYKIILFPSGDTIVVDRRNNMDDFCILSKTPVRIQYDPNWRRFCVVSNRMVYNASDASSHFKFEVSKCT